MSIEQEIDLEREFNRNFFNETGIVLRDRTQGYVRGTIGWGHDSGIDTNQVLASVIHSPEINYSVSGIKWGSQNRIENLLLSLEHGQAFIYTSDTDGEDPVSIIGEVHTVRKIGKSLQSKLNPKDIVRPTDNYKTDASFGWISGVTPYDSYSPDEIVKDLVRIGKSHSIVSNPSLHQANNFHFYQLFANIDKRCFVVSRIDSINIIGWKKEVNLVTAGVTLTLSKKAATIRDWSA